MSLTVPCTVVKINSGSATAPHLSTLISRVAFAWSGSINSVIDGFPYPHSRERMELRVREYNSDDMHSPSSPTLIDASGESEALLSSGELNLNAGAALAIEAIMGRGVSSDAYGAASRKTCNLGHPFNNLFTRLAVVSCSGSGGGSLSEISPMLLFVVRSLICVMCHPRP